MVRIIISVLCLILSFSAFATTVDEGISIFNQKEFKEAKAIFEPLAKQGDARAMFWLGVTQFRTGEQFKAGQTLLKSAEAGNPWAMLMMSPKDNGYCGYLGWPCDSTWRNKAFIKLEELADQGNGDAICELLYRKGKPWWAYVPIYNKKRGGELAEKGVKDGWYEMASCDISMNIEKKVKLLQYAANRNYAPAMVELYYIDEKKKYPVENSDELLKKAFRLGYSGAVFNLIFNAEKTYFKIETVSDAEGLTVKDKKDLEDLYYYSLIGKKFGIKNVRLNFDKAVNNNHGDRVVVSLLSPQRKMRIEVEAKKFLSKVKPNLFIGESSPMNALLNP